jgi:single-stranded-DNA-specific exonuclease
MRWEYRDQNTTKIKNIAAKYNLMPETARILLNRGIETEEQIVKFLEAKIDDMRDPYLFEEMENAVKKILEKADKNEKIFVYGDYDVDGITSAAFLTIALRAIGFDVDYYIPNRMEEGYGLNKKAIENIKKRQGKLIVTVDVGINSIDEVEYAEKNGIEIIVTDHHKAIENIEGRVITINPKTSEGYNFKFLSGAGVALKVASAIYQKINFDLDILYKYLDIVMIGTVADVVPMLDENRIIIKKGLERLKKTNVRGLEYLTKYLKLQRKDITTTDVSFFISPMLNALGRISDSTIGVDFFLEEDDFKIYNIIEEMKRANKERRNLEKQIYDETLKLLKKQPNSNYIFLKSKKWHSGVIGVVAARLALKYNKPVVLLSVSEGIAKASCRSIEGISIFNILKQVSDDFIRFGGHDLAVGFMAKESKLEKIEKAIKGSLEKNTFTKEEKLLKVDLKLEVEQITGKFLKEIKQLSPFGLGNFQPIILTENVHFGNPKKFGVENRHFKTFVKKGNKYYSAVAFNLGHKLDKFVSEAQSFNIVYYPEKIYYNGEEILQLKIKDFKPVDDFENMFKNF